jgi:hypothetical protein
MIRRLRDKIPILKGGSRLGAGWHQAKLRRWVGITVTNSQSSIHSKYYKGKSIAKGRSIYSSPQTLKSLAIRQGRIAFPPHWTGPGVRYVKLSPDLRRRARGEVQAT